MKLNLIEKKEILDFEQEIGYELEANERPIHLGGPRFHVHFKEGNIKKGIMLLGPPGNGNTVDEALKDYCKIISGRRMAFRVYSSEREEIQIPNLIHTKLIGC